MTRSSLVLLLLAGRLGLAQASSLSLSAPVVAGNAAAVSVNWVSGGTATAGLQWSLAGLPAGATIATGTAASGVMKSVTCGPQLSICLAVGLNATVIPDGAVAVISYPQVTPVPAIALSGVLGASPAGTAVTVVIPAGPCDVNRDGKVDVSDVSAAVGLANGTAAGSLDLNGDGKTDLFDVFRVLLAVLGGGPSACRVGQ